MDQDVQVASVVAYIECRFFRYIFFAFDYHLATGASQFGVKEPADQFVGFDPAACLVFFGDGAEV